MNTSMSNSIETIKSDFIIAEKKEMFNLHGDVSEDFRLSVDIKSIHNGTIKQLGVYNFSVLMCIASYMDSDGVSFPSQRKISELTGISVNKVTACVKDLLEIEINGRPLFTRSFAKGKKGKRTVYQFQSDKVAGNDLVESVKTIEPEAQQSSVADLMGASEEPVEEKPMKENPMDKKPMNAKDVVVLFAETYAETFGDGYMVSWGKEMKLVKDKLIPNFKSEDIKSIVKIAVGQYSEKWSNTRYPRPTISMMCGWLGKEAFKIVLAEKKQAEAMQTRIDSAQQSEDEMDRFLNL